MGPLGRKHLIIAMLLIAGAIALAGCAPAQAPRDTPAEGGPQPCPFECCTAGEFQEKACQAGASCQDNACAQPQAGPPEQQEAMAPTQLVIPQAILDNCMGFLVGERWELSYIPPTGGAWARPHPGPFAWQRIEPSEGTYDFRDTDFWVQEAQRNSVSLLGTLWPYADWDQEKCHGADCRVSSQDQFYPRIPSDGIPASRCKPCDMGSYEKFLVKLVERYDGDGKEDMPGLSLPVLHWEILNEPSMSAPDLTFFRGTEQDYVDILNASHSAIKGACPACVIVQGGAAGIHSEALFFWEEVFRLGGARYYDVANIHYINSGDIDNLNAASFLRAMRAQGVTAMPLWVTEAQFGNEQQVLGATRGAFNSGAEKVFYVSFTPGEMRPPSGPGRHAGIYESIPQYCP